MADLRPEDENDLVAELAREAVGEVAPDETPLFDANAELYLSDPESFLKEAKEKDDMLGFGAQQAVAFVTPFILMAMKDVVRFIATQVSETAKEESSPLIRDLIRRIFRRGKEQAPAPKEAGPTETQPPAEVPEAVPTQAGPGPAAAAPLGPDVLAEVRELIIARGDELKVPRVKSESVADYTVAQLVIS